jgi:hypothetical protein
MHLYQSWATCFRVRRSRAGVRRIRAAARRPHDRDRSRREIQQAQGHAADHPFTQRVSPLAPDDHQIGVEAVGLALDCLGDRFLRSGFDELEGSNDPGALERPAGRREAALRAAQRLGLCLGTASGGNGQDDEGGAAAGGEGGREPQRRSRSARAVRRNENSPPAVVSLRSHHRDGVTCLANPRRDAFGLGRREIERQ